MIFIVLASVAPEVMSGVHKIEVAGTIRGTADKGWYVISDQTHIPVNIKGITAERGAIKVSFDFKAQAIHTFVATPDETFAAKGYFIGSRVTREHALLLIARSKKGKQVIVNPERINEILGNIWIYGLFSVEDEEK